MCDNVPKDKIQPLPAFAQESGDQEDVEPEDACGESPTATEAVPWCL